jgi:very-short-patch-repair endonuclease
VAAARITGTVSHRTAALLHGWKVKRAPELPDVTLPRHRKLRAATRRIATLHWRDLDAADVTEGVTSPVRTVVDCCLDLPFDEALAVFDSALRNGLSRRRVQEAALRLGPRQRKKVSHLARLATPRAANPFESVLRAIALQVQGFSVVPQFPVRYDGFFATVDLADEDLQIVLEADSFEFHSQRRDFDRDCRRYDELVARDWLVLRFTWEQVMFDPDWVARVITDVVRLRRGKRGRVTGTNATRASA